MSALKLFFRSARSLSVLIAVTACLAAQPVLAQVSADPPSVDPAEAREWMNLMKRQNSLYGNGDAESAIKVCLEALEVAPSSEYAADTLIYLARAHQRAAASRMTRDGPVETDDPIRWADHYAETFHIFKRIIDAHPDSPHRPRAYVELGHISEVILTAVDEYPSVNLKEVAAGLTPGFSMDCYNMALLEADGAITEWSIAARGALCDEYIRAGNLPKAFEFLVDIATIDMALLKEPWYVGPFMAATSFVCDLAHQKSRADMSRAGAVESLARMGKSARCSPLSLSALREVEKNVPDEVTAERARKAIAAVTESVRNQLDAGSLVEEGTPDKLP